jgi:fumarate reductase subunit D
MGLAKRINALEPLWWALFGAGGAVAAFLLPAHILIHGVAIPMGWVAPDRFGYEEYLAWASSPLVKLYLLILIVFPLFHAAHRIRLTLEDLRSETLNKILPIVCYGGSVVLSLYALFVIVRI